RTRRLTFRSANHPRRPDDRSGASALAKLLTRHAQIRASSLSLFGGLPRTGMRHPNSRRCPCPSPPRLLEDSEITVFRPPPCAAPTHCQPTRNAPPAILVY